MTRDKVLEAVKQTPGLSKYQIAEQTGISEKAVENHLYRLRTDGLVKPDGVIKTGAKGQPAKRWIPCSSLRVSSVFNLA